MNTTPPAAKADRDKPGAVVAAGKTLAERLQFLVANANRILARPEVFTLAERRWAHDILSAPATRRTSKPGPVPICLRRKHAR